MLTCATFSYDHINSYDSAVSHCLYTSFYGPSPTSSQSITYVCQTSVLYLIHLFLSAFSNLLVLSLLHLYLCIRIRIYLYMNNAQHIAILSLSIYIYIISITCTSFLPGTQPVPLLQCTELLVLLKQSSSLALAYYLKFFRQLCVFTTLLLAFSFQFPSHFPLCLCSFKSYPSITKIEFLLYFAFHTLCSYPLFFSCLFMLR